MGNPEAVIVGQIVATHGLSGSVRVRVLSDVPHRFDVGQTLSVGVNRYRIESTQPIRSGQLLLVFQGFHTKIDSRSLVGQYVTVPVTESPPLPEGEYFHYQLMGLRVVTEDNEELGTISDILETGSNDVYVVTGAGSEILIPGLAEVVKGIRLDDKIMVVDLPEGLR